MAAVCQVTGAIPGFGHNISHSHRRTKRRFDPNIQKKTLFRAFLEAQRNLDSFGERHQDHRCPWYRIRHCRAEA